MTTRINELLLIETDAGMHKCIDDMNLLRQGVFVARSVGDVDTEVHIAAMHLALRLLWGMCGDMMLSKTPGFGSDFLNDGRKAAKAVHAMLHGTQLARYYTNRAADIMTLTAKRDATTQ